LTYSGKKLCWNDGTEAQNSMGGAKTEFNFMSIFFCGDILFLKRRYFISQNVENMVFVENIPFILRVLKM